MTRRATACWSRCSRGASRLLFSADGARTSQVGRARRRGYRLAGGERLADEERFADEERLAGERSTERVGRRRDHRSDDLGLGLGPRRIERAWLEWRAAQSDHRNE